MAAPRNMTGDVVPVSAPVATALAVAIGDICGLQSNTLIKPSGLTWDTNLATTQTTWATLFLGLSLQLKVANVARIFGNSEDNIIQVATRDVWEFDLTAAATVEIGEYYGPAKDTGNALLDNVLVKVASQALAIGICVKRETTASRVRIRLLSTLSPGARQ